MQTINKGDIITICCSGVVSYYRVLEPETLLCDLIASRTGAPTGRRYNLEFESFGFLDETETTTVENWGNHIPEYQSVVAGFKRMHEVKLCQSET